MADGILTPIYDSPTMSVPLPEEKSEAINKEGRDNKGRYFLIVLLLLAFCGTVYAVRDTLVSFIGNNNSGSKPTPSLTPAATSVPVVNRSLSEAHNIFGFNVLKQIVKSEPGKNIFISPSSIALALSMVYNGADGETKTAMEQAMQLSGMSLEDVNSAGAGLMDQLKNPDSKVEIAIANSIWGRKGIIFNSDFLAQNQKYYSARVESLDFSLLSSADVINKWVSDNTREKIKEIVDKPINPQLVMFLINAVYFKGSWTYEFDQKLTIKRDFDNSGVKKKALMMEQHRKDFSYLENDLFQAVSLPYGTNKRLRMLVFLPKSNLGDLLSQLSIENWKVWKEGLEGPASVPPTAGLRRGKQEGTVILPKFKMEYDKELSSVLSDLGMGIAFDPIQANFKKMADLTENLYISFVKHKTYVDVNEEGTEAAAVTSIGVALTALRPDEEKIFYMEVNKPFLFVIEDSQTGEVLFIGTVNNPN